MSHRDDVEVLEREFAEAMHRLYTVGNGLARLRADLDRPVAAAAPAWVPTPAPVAAPPVPGPPPAAPGVPPSMPAFRPESTSSTGATPAAVLPAQGPAARRPVEPWYRREGMVTRVVGVAGAVVTLAGVAMLLVLAVRHGWFGPLARVSSGAALAVVLGVLGARGGARDRGRGRAVGAAPVALVATGPAAAYLDVVAVTTVYGWVPAVVGLALCLVVGVVGLLLSRVWGSELLAVLMVGGAAAFSPLVAGEAGWVLSGVLAVLSAAGWWASGGRPAPRLTMVRTSPVALSLVVAAAWVTSASAMLALLAVAALTLAGTLVTSAATLRRHPGAVTSTVAVGLTAAAALVVAGSQSEAVRTPALAVLAAVLLLAATALGRAPFGPLPLHLVATTASAGAVSAVLAVLTGAPDRFVVTGLLLLALGHVGAAAVTRSRLSLVVGAGVSAVALVPWLLHPAALTSVRSAAQHDLAVAFVDSALVLGLAALAAFATQSVRRVPDTARVAVRIAAVGVGLLGLATMLVAVGTLAGRSTGSLALGFTVGHSLATVSWMLAAAALLLRSLELRSDAVLRWGLALGAVALGKLFLFDLGSLDGIVRSVAFIATGLLLLATGSKYARAWERSAGA